MGSAKECDALMLEEYLRLDSDDVPTELVRGRIVRSAFPFSSHGFFCCQVAGLLHEHVTRSDSGRVTINSGIVTQRNPDTLRRYDVAYYSYQRVPRGPLPDGYWPTPELVAEVLWEEKQWSDVVEKASEFIEAGVIILLVVDPALRSVQLLSATRCPKVFGDGDTLALPDVLPGFTVPVRQLFE